MVDEPLEDRAIKWSGPASRRMDALARTQPRATSAIVEFVYGPLRIDPYRVGKPLAGHLIGRYSARRGDYRVIYRITERTVVVEAVGHRSSIYRPG